MEGQTEIKGSLGFVCCTYLGLFQVQSTHSAIFDWKVVLVV